MKDPNKPEWVEDASDEERREAESWDAQNEDT